jgi:preprotein translocase subunit Sec61beta
MAKEKKTRMPSGMAGLMRYDEVLKESPKIKPEWVIWFSVGLVLVELILKFLG